VFFLAAQPPNTPKAYNLQSKLCSEYTILKKSLERKMQVIVRHEKHHTIGTIKASASHTMRTRPTANADPHGPAPEVWVGSADPAQDVLGALPAKRRKNAVLSLEYLVTASPEFFAQEPAVWRAYLADQLAMLQSYFDKENVVSAVLHLDERTPHLSVQVVPLIDGKLNARALVGTREACRIIQDLAGEVGKPYGVLRGKPRSTAKHKDVRHWYQDLVPKIAEAKKSIEKSSADLSEAEQAIDQAQKTSKKLIFEAENESKKIIFSARKRIEKLDEELEFREKEVQKKAAENDAEMSFLNTVSSELKAVFRALPEAIFIKLPDALQNQLIKVFELTNLEVMKTAKTAPEIVSSNALEKRTKKPRINVPKSSV
jgi:vacuolar-type H+-ATPase subunit H